MLLRNRLDIGVIDVPDFDVRDQRGDFKPLIAEDIFYKAQAVLSGKVPLIAPLMRNRPDFPLRGFVRCAACDRGLAGSWSKGRSNYYAYYHCRPGCRGVNVTKAKLEGLFVDELARLQPAAGYMRLLKESVLQVWKERKASVQSDLESAEQARKKLQQKLNRLDEAFLFERSIDIDTYDRHADRVREQMTLLKIDEHTSNLEELDVEGILAFAERVLPRAADLWVQVSLDHRRRLQRLFFPQGVRVDGNSFVGTAVTAPAFSYLEPVADGKERLVDQICPRWNPVTSWLRQVGRFRTAA